MISSPKKAKIKFLYFPDLTQTEKTEFLNFPLFLAVNSITKRRRAHSA